MEVDLANAAIPGRHCMPTALRSMQSEHVLPQSVQPPEPWQESSSVGLCQRLAEGLQQGLQYICCRSTSSAHLFQLNHKHISYVVCQASSRVAVCAQHDIILNICHELCHYLHIPASKSSLKERTNSKCYVRCEGSAHYAESGHLQLRFGMNDDKDSL